MRETLRAREYTPTPATARPLPSSPFNALYLLSSLAGSPAGSPAGSLGNLGSHGKLDIFRAGGPAGGNAIPGPALAPHGPKEEVPAEGCAVPGGARSADRKQKGTRKVEKGCGVAVLSPQRRRAGALALLPASCSVMRGWAGTPTALLQVVPYVYCRHPIFPTALRTAQHSSVAVVFGGGSGRGGPREDPLTCGVAVRRCRPHAKDRAASMASGWGGEG